jgi:hypothetical protein
MVAVRASAGGFDLSSSGGFAACDAFEKNCKPRTDPQVSNASDLVRKLTGPWVKQ